MPRMIAAVLLLLFALGQAVAGPPEKSSAKMVLDEVADGLRKYRKEQDTEKRIRWLKKLAPTKDPRVAVALGDALDVVGPIIDDECHFVVVDLIIDNFVRGMRSPADQ